MGIIKDPTSWRAGFELGLAGFSFPYSKPRKPTAYLYNGIRLPALPEWDRGVYPYAYIVGLHPTHFCASPNEPYVIETENFITGEKGHATKFRENTTVLRWYPNENGEWVTVKSDDYTTSSTLPVLTWTDFDLLNEDGTVFMSASEPVPVYE